MSSELDIVEDWKWNAPNFHNKGMVCWLASFKHHVGLNFLKVHSLRINTTFLSRVEMTKAIV
tara:strand:+ start:472 stop:657 length:186 start_codon:yes stop_codon:yes gene_type:complete